MLEDMGISPAQLLNVAMRKRRELFERKEPDLHRELLHKTLVQQLCKEVGEKRAKRHHHRRRHRSGSKRRRSRWDVKESEQPMTKRACYDGDEEEDRLVISEDQGEDSLGEDFVDSFKGDSVSMVQVSTHSPIDYNQMEQYLDATGKGHGYQGHWSSPDSDERSLTTLQPMKTSAEIDPSDPLSMNELFRQLYQSSVPIRG